MVKAKAWYRMGHLFEVLLIVAGLLFLLQHPLQFTSDTGLVVLFGTALIALSVVFPVTLPSMLISLELVFTFYFVITYDLATALWVNFFGELVGTLLVVHKSRKIAVLTNPMLKVICLMAGFFVFALVEPTWSATHTESSLNLLKLLLIGTVFFVSNHLTLHVHLYLRTRHFSWRSCLHAVMWESVIYLAVFPLAMIGNLLEPQIGLYTLWVLGVPVAVVTGVIRTFNHLQWSNRVNYACINLSTSKELGTIFHKTFQIARELTDSPRAMMLKKQPDGSFQGMDRAGVLVENIRHPLLERAVSEQAVLSVLKATEAENLFPEWEVRSYILVPLVGKTKVFGVICMGKPNSYGFKADHQKQLGFLANQVSIIMDRNHVYEELERASITNQLTGLYNYQYFYEQLDIQFHAAKVMGEDLCLIIFDIDYFKKYNDIYGHIVGDEVLRQVAMIAKSVCEQSNAMLARYGGEEFVAIGRMTVSEGYALAEEVRLKIQDHQFVYQEHTVKNITISVGLAHLHTHDALSPNDLLEKADQSLYWGAKEMGRNRVAVYCSEFDQRLFVDSLTGLHTIYYLRRKLRSLCENQNHFPMHFLLVDILGMRTINDRHGFEIGNRVLIDVSYLLKNTMRGDDLICRYMDDEFLVVVKGTPEADLGIIRKRIHDAFAKHRFPSVGEVSVDLTVVTLGHADEEPFLLERIDTARRSYSREAAAVVFRESK
ncbi:GGDEF domain-containing protein [Tumebacillus permanentifrigoris]|uniref:Diguanylate cyclase (GGDEF)-like protein n=1 Tax=Tumebacillus permanentifrigoris TaxID=378543 RepID=A0A316D7N1_9BACL|nr:GGDEF domain-containing protein [Tumebacillus permanentifrigoris]PWK11578.1 diguanylate cyclase (GGDEF)-like protein [Tumebacillus permanentifrigoris]